MRAAPCALVLLAALVAAPAAAEHRIIAPADGAVVSEAAAFLIGVGTHDTLTVTLNGAPLPVSRIGGSFTGRLTLRPGRNVITAAAGPGDSTQVTVVLDPKAAGETYRYHAPLLDGDCKECHPQGVGRTAVVEAQLCRSCHDPKEGARFLHGPIGAGQCTVCHDPHGAPRGHFLRGNLRELCQSCHDQNRTKVHLERAGARPCTECHDPHGSGKQYLLY